MKVNIFDICYVVPISDKYKQEGTIFKNNIIIKVRTDNRQKPGTDYEKIISNYLSNTALF